MAVAWPPRLKREGAELATENRRIEADLEAEEQELTELRNTLPAGEFRLLADAFDAKVQETRAAQAAKGRALNARVGQGSRRVPAMPLRRSWNA